jgi:hypothetical protein
LPKLTCAAYLPGRFALGLEFDVLIRMDDRQESVAYLFGLWLVVVCYSLTRLENLDERCNNDGGVGAEHGSFCGSSPTRDRLLWARHQTCQIQDVQAVEA